MLKINFPPYIMMDLVYPNNSSTMHKRSFLGHDIYVIEAVPQPPLSTKVKQGCPITSLHYIWGVMIKLIRYIWCGCRTILL